KGHSEGVEVKGPNVTLYDKCIYSVPNKGKYRNAPVYGNGDSKGVCDSPKDCDGGSISSDTHLPDDVCSEYTDYLNHEPLRKQLKGIEGMYSEVWAPRMIGIG